MVPCFHLPERAVALLGLTDPAGRDGLVDEYVRSVTFWRSMGAIVMTSHPVQPADMVCNCLSDLVFSGT